MAPCYQSPFLCRFRAWCWVCDDLQPVPRPSFLIWYRYGWCLGSRLFHRTRKSSSRGPWSCIRRSPAGIRFRISHRGCDKPSPRPSHVPYMASSLLGFRGHIRLCRSHSSPLAGERDLPSRESSGAREGHDDWEEDPRVHTPSWYHAQGALAPLRLRRASDDRYVSAHVEVELMTHICELGFNFLSHGSQDLYPTYLQTTKNFDSYHSTVATIIGNCGAIAYALLSIRSNPTLT